MTDINYRTDRAQDEKDGEVPDLASDIFVLTHPEGVDPLCPPDMLYISVHLFDYRWPI